jgi:hypothetical protein
MNVLNSQARAFVTALRHAERYENDCHARDQKTDLFHVDGAGKTLSLVYEQVRNAAEYAEEHLLLRRAIRRFYARMFMTGEKVGSTGEELVTELTMAGYIPNDSVTHMKITQMSEVAREYYGAYEKLHTLGMQTQRAWSIDVLSVEIEAILQAHAVRSAYEQFVFDHFKASIDQTALRDGGKEFEPLLFVAIHKALFMSDDATIRHALLSRFAQKPSQLADYKRTNQQIDALLEPIRSEQLRRIVSREGAVFRVLASMLRDQAEEFHFIDTPTKFLPAFESAVNVLYESTETRINRGVLRSIIFLLITKAIIGVAIEIPYDLLFHDSIAWLVLGVNLLLPPLYMLLLRLTLQLPDSSNTTSLVAQADKLLYGNTPPVYVPARRSQQYGAAFNIIYALLILGMFAAVSWLLMQVGFEIVHLVIFFIFFSTASFLGFRLSRAIRELETTESRQNGVGMIRDFIYLPFVVVGRKLSESYAKLNIVGTFLDMFIELPLKAVLRTVRQWDSFISSKKDEL